MIRWIVQRNENSNKQEPAKGHTFVKAADLARIACFCSFRSLLLRRICAWVF
jgi:hypothetical protein